MIEANKLKLGLFVSLSTVLLIASLLVLGFSNIFDQKYEFFTIFDESVQGLEKGAQIKYKGVKIGQVTKISVWKTRYVRVDMEYDPDAVFTENVNNLPTRQDRMNAVQDFLRGQVAKGLRCSLEISSLATGLKFIELTHIDHSRKLEVKVDLINKNGYVPAMKSLLSGAITNFDKTLTNIAKVDYEGIGIEAKKTLIYLNEVLSDPKIKNIVAKSDALLDKLNKTTATIDSKVNELEVKELQAELRADFRKTFNQINTSIISLSTRLDTSVKNFDKTVSHLHKEIEQAKISETSTVARMAMQKTANAIDKVEGDASAALKQAKIFLEDLHNMEKDIHAAIKSVEAAGSSMAGFRGDFTSTLKRFKSTLDSIKSFIDYLEKDPSALLRGKAK